MKFAIAVLLGFTAAIKFRPDPSRQPWADKTPPAPTNEITGAFAAHEDGNGYYDRVMPDRFEGESSTDTMIRGMISRWALEGKGADGNPNGMFYCTRACADKLGEEVVNTHLGYTGAKNKAFRDKFLNKAWEKADELNKGFLTVDEMPTVMKAMLGEVELNNNLTVQVEEEGALSSEFRPNPVQSPFAAKPAEAPKATPLNTGFKANHADNNLGYEREPPAHFSEPSDDLLMNSLIMKHAIEGKAADGSKNGKFYMDRYNTDLLAQEVVATHLKL